MTEGIPIEALNPELQQAIAKLRETGKRTENRDGNTTDEAQTKDDETCEVCGQPAPGPRNTCGHEGCPFQIPW